MLQGGELLLVEGLDVPSSIVAISDRILNIRQLSDYKRPIRCTPLVVAF
jgi:hypothetical protein